MKKIHKMELKNDLNYEIIIKKILKSYAQYDPSKASQTSDSIGKTNTENITVSV